MGPREFISEDGPVLTLNAASEQTAGKLVESPEQLTCTGLSNYTYFLIDSFTSTVRGRRSYYFHLTDENTESQRGEATCPGSHSSTWRRLSGKPRVLVTRKLNLLSPSWQPPLRVAHFAQRDPSVSVTFESVTETDSGSQP